MLSGADATPGRVTLPVTEPEAHPASPAVASIRITNAYPRLPGAIRRLPGCRATRIAGRRVNRWQPSQPAAPSTIGPWSHHAREIPKSGLSFLRGSMPLWALLSAASGSETRDGSDPMDEQTLRHLMRDVESRTPEPPPVHAGPDRARADGAHGRPDPGHRWPLSTPSPRSRCSRRSQRGGGGPLRTLWWQAPTLLNPHFATGTKDQDASRIFYEPLVGYDPDGNLVPVLAAEVPSVANGGLAKDGTCGHLASEEGRDAGTTASRSPPTTWSSPGSSCPTRPPPP